MQACNYSFLKDAIVHLNIKYGLWFQSKIFVGFYQTTTNKQSKQQHKSDTFQAGFFFLFLLQGDAETCILWFIVQRKDISQMEYFFVHPLFTDSPKSFILKFFRRLGCNFLFNSGWCSPTVSQVFSLPSPNFKQTNKFLISWSCVELEAIVKPMKGNWIMCATWILECIHLVLRAGLMGACRKHYMYV